MAKKPFLKDKTLALSVEYGKSYNWDIRFLESDFPSDFRKWFPAISVKEPLIDPETYSFNIGNISLDIVSGYKQPVLSLEFYDNDKGELAEYIRNWINNFCLGKFTFVRPIEECLKTVEVIRTDNKGKTSIKTTYKVVAKSSMVRESNSSSNIIQYSVDFIVASMSV